MEEMKLIVRIALHRMYDHYLPKLLHSIQALNTEQLWKHHGWGINSIGGIVLHICEHVQRNTIRYLHPNKKFDTGIEEYFPQWNVAPDMLCTMVQEVFDNWKRELINIINKNECNTVDIHSFLHLVEHTSYHLGQIVDRVKKATGISFQFCQNGLNESMLRPIIKRETNE